MRRRKRTFTENVRRVYLALCNVVKFVSLSATLFLIPILIGYIVFHVFWAFSPVKVLVACLCLWVMTDCNAKM